MKKNLLAIIAAVIVALHLIGCVRQSDAPLLIVSQGRAVKTENCENPSTDNQTTCRGFFCEIALHQQDVLPPYASVQQSSHQYNFSDQPGRSIYLAKYETSDKTMYVKCELEGNTVKVISRISEYDFEQR